MYPTKEELETIRLFLSKKTGIKDAAKKAKCSENMIYKALNIETFKEYHLPIITDCLEVIKKEAEKRIAFADEKILKFTDETEEKMQRV